MITLLAPMAGFTDNIFRRICASFGAEKTVTEMVSAKALYYEDKKTAELAKLTEPDENCAIQIFGHEPEIMGLAAEKLASGEYKYSKSTIAPFAIDINMGCPMKKIVSSDDGSALMREPALCGKIVSACVRGAERYGIPVTVKIRAGWDSESVNAAEIAKICEASGASMITVHARTREQMYASGAVNISVIADVKRAVRIPVIGNGDIFTARDALEMVEKTGCDGVAVARGALGNPFVFREIKALGSGFPSAPVTTAERLDVAYRHAEFEVAERGERGIIEMRGHLSRYLRGFDGSARMRGEINSASTLSEIRSILFE